MYCCLPYRTARSSTKNLYITGPFRHATKYTLQRNCKQLHIFVWFNVYNQPLRPPIIMVPYWCSCLCDALPAFMKRYIKTAVGLAVSQLQSTDIQTQQCKGQSQNQHWNKRNKKQANPKQINKYSRNKNSSSSNDDDENNKNNNNKFYVLLTVHPGTTLRKRPTWCTIAWCNTFIIIILYMFRATLCSSAGGQIVLIQHLV